MPVLRLRIFLDEDYLKRAKDIAKRKKKPWRKMLESLALLGIEGDIDNDDSAYDEKFHSADQD